MKSKLLSASIIVFSFSLPALAAVQNVPFNAQVDATCSIALMSPGVMAQNGVSELDSQVAGGRSGRVAITTTGRGFNLSTTAPSTFTTAPGLGGPVSFNSSYKATGATFIANTPGNAISQLNQGATNVDVDLSATANGFVFPLGRYTAEVTVTCE